MMYHFIFITLLLFGYSVNSQDVMTNSIGNEIVINKVVDELLKFVKVAIIEKGLDRTSTPDLNLDFVGPFHIPVKFLAQQGTAANISTVKRTGDDDIEFKNMTAALNLHFGFDEVTSNYGKYIAKVSHFRRTGEMLAVIHQLSVQVTISLHYNYFDCKEELAFLRVEQIGDIKVSLTGFHSLDWLVNDLTKKITQKLRSNIILIIEDTIKEAVTSGLAKYNICKYLPHS